MPKGRTSYLGGSSVMRGSPKAAGGRTGYPFKGSGKPKKKGKTSSSGWLTEDDLAYDRRQQRKEKAQARRKARGKDPSP